VRLGQSRRQHSKHGVSFHAGCEVFFDLRQDSGRQQPDRIPRGRLRLNKGERLHFVVHVIRHEETIRIISAREATREEHRQYENS
jgi:uncharacterized DUF497 family protein